MVPLKDRKDVDKEFIELMQKASILYEEQTEISHENAEGCISDILEIIKKKKKNV